MVIAEGPDDVAVVDAVATDLGLPSVQALPFEGVSNLRGFLRALTSVSGFEGVRSLDSASCDAEESAGAGFLDVEEVIGVLEAWREQG